MERIKHRHGQRLLRVAVAAGAAMAVTLPILSTDAAVGGRRSIEVTTTSDMVILEGYPTGAKVKIMAFRKGVMVGSAIKRVQPGGSIELNHGGGTDCWESAKTPDLRPGYRIRTRILGTSIIDNSIVRGVFIDGVVRDDTSITVSGHVNMTGRTAANTGILELRVRTDSDDLRQNVRGEVTDSGGSFSRTVPVAAGEADGAEVVVEWSNGGGGELTVAEPKGAAARLPGCPPVEK